MQRVSAVMAGLVLVLAALNVAYGAGYVFTSPEYPDASFTIAQGINVSDTIVGEYGDAADVSHGFAMTGTAYASVDYPDALATAAHGINNTGAVVGDYEDGAGVYHGFVMTGTAYASVDYPDALASMAYGINDAGVIVGEYGDADDLEHGFVLSGTTYTSVDYPSATATIAYGVNSGGTIVGTYTDADYAYHGFTLSGAVYTSVDYPGATDTYATGVASGGTIIGHYQDEGGKRHAFTLSGATYASIDYPGALATFAYGVNDTGAIVGVYEDVTGTYRSFLAIPDADVVNGTCGSANNGVFMTAPAASGLCSAGDPSSVSDTGSAWTWTCGGSNRGLAVDCRAAKGVGTLTVVKKGTGTGTVTSTPTGISCGATCSAPFGKGYVTLTANPALDSNFASWKGCTSVEESLCIVYLAANKTVKATFTRKPLPVITTLSPSSGTIGTSVKIRGKHFGASQGTSTVSFNSTAADVGDIIAWSDTVITCKVPVGASTGLVRVTTVAGASGGKTFSVKPPSITALAPSSGTVGTSVKIRGKHFGASQGTSTVSFNNTTADVGDIIAWSDTVITCKVPVGASTGLVKVTTSVGASKGKQFTVKN